MMMIVRGIHALICPITKFGLGDRRDGKIPDFKGFESFPYGLDSRTNEGDAQTGVQEVSHAEF